MFFLYDHHSALVAFVPDAVPAAHDIKSGKHYCPSMNHPGAPPPEDRLSLFQVIRRDQESQRGAGHNTPMDPHAGSIRRLTL